MVGAHQSDSRIPVINGWRTRQYRPGVANAAPVSALPRRWTSEIPRDGLERSRRWAAVDGLGDDDARQEADEVGPGSQKQEVGEHAVDDGEEAVHASMLGRDERRR